MTPHFGDIKKELIKMIQVRNLVNTCDKKYSLKSEETKYISFSFIIWCVPMLDLYMSFNKLCC
jgi:hypothetical protein